jgi:hypothetical protein
MANASAGRTAKAEKPATPTWHELAAVTDAKRRLWLRSRSRTGWPVCGREWDVVAVEPMAAGLEALAAMRAGTRRGYQVLADHLSPAVRRGSGRLRRHLRGHPRCPGASGGHQLLTRVRRRTARSRPTGSATREATNRRRSLRPTGSPPTCGSSRPPRIRRRPCHERSHRAVRPRRPDRRGAAARSRNARTRGPGGARVVRSRGAAARRLRTGRAAADRGRPRGRRRCTRVRGRLPDDDGRRLFAEIVLGEAGSRLSQRSRNLHGVRNKARLLRALYGRLDRLQDAVPAMEASTGASP